MKDNEKMFLLYINIDFKSLKINILSVSIAGRAGKVL